jgi:hypothetical protein
MLLNVKTSRRKKVLIHKIKTNSMNIQDPTSRSDPYVRDWFSVDYELQHVGHDYDTSNCMPNEDTTRLRQMGCVKRKMCEEVL